MGRGVANFCRPREFQSVGMSLESPLGIHLDSVTFSYPGQRPFIDGINLALPRGSRCLLIGANGTGKTTLLQMVAGEFGSEWVAHDSPPSRSWSRIAGIQMPGLHAMGYRCGIRLHSPPFAGKYMVPRSAISVLGRPPFHDTVGRHPPCVLMFCTLMTSINVRCILVLPHPSRATSPRLQQLTCSGQLSYLGTSWRKDVAFAGYGVPLQVEST